MDIFTLIGNNIFPIKIDEINNGFAILFATHQFKGSRHLFHNLMNGTLYYQVATVI